MLASEEVLTNGAEVSDHGGGGLIVWYPGQIFKKQALASGINVSEKAMISLGLHRLKKQNKTINLIHYLLRKELSLGLALLG